MNEQGSGAAAYAAPGLDGIKMMSYLGGFPALFLGIFSLISLIRILRKPERFDKHNAISTESEDRVN